MKRPTPAARALVGCLSLADGAPLNEAAKLAGYSLKSASHVEFFRGRAYRDDLGCRRVITRNGRIVKVSHRAVDASMWMLRLGRKLAALQVQP